MHQQTKTPAQQIQEIIQASPLPAKRVLELAKRPKGTAISQLQAMAGLTRNQATTLVHLLQQGR